MSKYTIKGITSSKDAPTKLVASTRLSKYMKKGSKMMKAPIKKSGDCGCGGGKIKMQTGGKVNLTPTQQTMRTHVRKNPYTPRPLGSLIGAAAGTASGYITQSRAYKKQATMDRLRKSRGTYNTLQAGFESVKPTRPVAKGITTEPIGINVPRPLKYENTAPATAANSPYNSHNPNDPYKDTNLSVGGEALPKKLVLKGPAFKQYKQGQSQNGVPSIHYTGEGTDIYSNRANRNVLGRYLGQSNPGMRMVMINGQRVMIR